MSAQPFSEEPRGKRRRALGTGVPTEKSAEAPAVARRALWRFMGYVWPYAGLIVMATVCGLVKFDPALEHGADLQVHHRSPGGKLGGAASGGDDVVMRSIDAYLAFAARSMPERFGTAWGAFNLLMITLVGVYALWAVCFYFRSYLAQLAGHRVILDLRTDLYRHLMRMGHGFYQGRQSGSVVSRLMADVALAQNFVGNAMTNIWMDRVLCLLRLRVVLHGRAAGVGLHAGVPVLRGQHARASGGRPRIPRGKSRRPWRLSPARCRSASPASSW